MPKRVSHDQYLLFEQEPRTLAESIGLDWWAAKKLYDDKWLSFDPERAIINLSGMEAEFIFLGTLVAAGCDPYILKRLLRGLEKPYCYNISEIYYDWKSQCWKELPIDEQNDLEPSDIVDKLIEVNDTEALLELKELVDDAIQDLDDEMDDPKLGLPDGIKPPLQNDRSYNEIKHNKTTDN